MKKTKLFLSICMMCLCVAVLCIGILAASSATYQINGNISYNMIDGVARINTRVYKVAGDPASESDLQTAVTGTFLTTSSFAVIEANQSPIYAQTYQNKETLEYTDTPTTKDYDINVVYGANNDADAYYTYYVVIQIYNQTETSGYVLNASITNTDGTKIANTSSSYVATNTSVSKIKQNTFSNIVIGISAQSAELAQTLTNSTERFTYELSVIYEEAPNIVKVQTNMYSTDVGISASTYTKASTLRTTAKSMETATEELSGTEISSATSEIRLDDTETTLTTGSQTIDYSVAKTYWIVSEVKNESSETVYVKITDSTINANYVIGSSSVNVDIGERDFITSGSLIYRSGDIVSLASGEVRRLVMCYAQYTDGVSISSLTSGYTLEIGKELNYSPLKFQPAQTLLDIASNTYSKSAYYYVEMGDFYGLPVRWRMIAESTTSTSGNDVYQYDYAGTEYYKLSSYTSDSITDGSRVDGIFIQDTYTAKLQYGTYNWSAYTSISKIYTELSNGESLTSCAFNNDANTYVSGGTVYKYDESWNKTEFLLEDYFHSKLRDYLNGVNVEKFPDKNAKDSVVHISNYLTDLNIANTSYVYNEITPRSSSHDKEEWAYSDKFWVLSESEIEGWYIGGYLLADTGSYGWLMDRKDNSNWGYNETYGYDNDGYAKIRYMGSTFTLRNVYLGYSPNTVRMVDTMYGASEALAIGSWTPVRGSFRFSCCR